MSWLPGIRVGLTPPACPGAGDTGSTMRGVAAPLHVVAYRPDGPGGLADPQATGATGVPEVGPTLDHTERARRTFGAEVVRG